jgi:uncharacterized membrane protein
MKTIISNIANTVRNTTTATLTKVATAGVLAAAVFMATPNKAQAQVRFGVRIGGPVVYGPVYAPAPVIVRPYPVYRGYYGPAYGYGYRPYFREHDRFHRDWR